jgi:ribosome maturation factor RimP
MMQEKVAQLEKIIMPILREADLELFRLAVKPYRGTANIELFVDHAQGGISLEECARVNHLITRSVETDGIYGDDYTVSVSSPGLDWPLEEPRDFRRLIGYDICIEHQCVTGAAKIQGMILSVGDNDIDLKVNGEEVTLLLEHIQKAVVMI